MYMYLFRFRNMEIYISKMIVLGWCVLYVYCSVHCTLPVVLHVATDVSVTVASIILVNMELKKKMFEILQCSTFLLK